ncbi:mitochondrial intermembrane space import and assembly protein 40 [Zeugodacus cucurbitae]|uniref:Mitochondrial intermembrane space import and assembly protein 40 n=1 Tax=Zeugodacus cucurbitae TaxID=28588 RepID=A0A0A1X4I9_ZEUCU|nr:mitochondrial intermembrane space import and assembly protein 40 [Zeugodacus cucurbitae]
MSYCKVFGKDKVFFVTKEDHATPSTIELPPPEPPQGLITSDGEINWSCPCLGGMATGPCGVEFRDAFSCFHYSKADPKGSDCFEAFRSMQDCFTQYPTVYNKSTGNDEDDEEGGLNMPTLEEEAAKEPSSFAPSVEGTAVLTKKEN